MKSIWTTLAIAVFIAGCASSASKEEASAETAGGGGAESASKEAETPAAATFASIQPILQQKCAGCHGEKPAEKIDLRTHEAVMKGGEHGAIVKPGDAKGSAIVMVLRGEGGMKKMPLNQPPLSDAEIAAIEKWVNEGANP